MISVAIDGPASAGKSTVAKGAAQKLGFLHVDTGALYRTTALHLNRSRISPKDHEEKILQTLKNLDIELQFQNGAQKTLLSQEDVSASIRTPLISELGSSFSALPIIRAHLLELQRSVAENHNIIMDGRDIGTVILPNADVKIFLTASAEKRAKRRLTEFLEKGINAAFEEVLRDISARDLRDTTRPIAPLVAAKDAIVLDTTDLTLVESIAAAIEIIKKGTTT